MTDQPLGITDLRAADSLAAHGEHWYWCRRHEQAHKVGERCLIDGTQYEYPKDSDCIDIGPFMTEREAKRLGEVVGLSGDGSGMPSTIRKPLGMEVGS